MPLVDLQTIPAHRPHILLTEADHKDRELQTAKVVADHLTQECALLVQENHVLRAKLTDMEMMIVRLSNPSSFGS